MEKKFLSNTCRIRNHQREKRQEDEEEKIEGEELKRLAVQYEQEKKRLFDIQQREAHQLMTDNLQQISDVYKMRDIQKAQEEVSLESPLKYCQLETAILYTGRNYGKYPLFS